MGAGAVSQRRRLGAVELQPFRLGEHLRVAVGRAEQEQDLVVRGQYLIRQRHRLLEDSGAEHLDRGDIARQFVEGQPGQLRLARPKCELALVREQLGQTAAQQAHCGLRAGTHESGGHDDDLLGAQPVVAGGCGEHGHQIVARCGAPFGDEVDEVVVDGRGCRVRAIECRVVVPAFEDVEPLADQALEHLVVRRRDPDEVADDGDRQRKGQPAHEVAGVGERVDQIAHHPLDPRSQRADPAGAEGAGDQAAKPGVRCSVAHQHAGVHHPQPRPLLPVRLTGRHQQAAGVLDEPAVAQQGVAKAVTGHYQPAVGGRRDRAEFP